MMKMVTERLEASSVKVTYMNNRKTGMMTAGEAMYSMTLDIQSGNSFSMVSENTW